MAQPRPPSLALPPRKLSPKVTETAYYDHMAQSRLPLGSPSGRAVRCERTPFPISLRHTRADAPPPWLSLWESCPMRTHSVSHILTTYPRRRASPLALPLGELSPKVTERASLPPMYVLVRKLTKHISANALRFPCSYDIPVQSRLPLGSPSGRAVTEGD